MRIPTSPPASYLRPAMQGVFKAAVRPSILEESRAVHASMQQKDATLLALSLAGRMRCA